MIKDNESASVAANKSGTKRNTAGDKFYALVIKALEVFIHITKLSILPLARTYFKCINYAAHFMVHVLMTAFMGYVHILY